MQAQAITRARSKGEHGAVLMEAIISAVVAMACILGILSSMDLTSKVSASNRSRGTAADLAQQDQDRLRGYRAIDLSNLHQVRAVNVAGLTYTVTSRADWVRDASGVVSCTSDTTQAQYMRITSSVTWANMGKIPAVVVASLVAPPPGAFSANQGTAAVQVTDHAGAAVPGLTVNVSGPSAAPADTTNSLGCAVFGYLTAGTYNVAFSRSGWVDPTGAQSINASRSVIAGSTTLMAFSYDVAGQINVTFDTQNPATNVVSPTASKSVSVANTGPPSGTRTFTDPAYTTALASNTIVANTLYPFTGSYGVYGGSCSDADPTTHINNYYTTNAGSVFVTPGGNSNVTVRLPTLQVQVKSGLTGNPLLTNANVVFTASGSGCTAVFRYKTNSTGTVNAALPFGTYGICADDGLQHARSITGVANNTVTGSTRTGANALILATTLSSNCP